MFTDRSSPKQIKMQAMHQLSAEKAQNIETFVTENLKKDLQEYDKYLNKMNLEIIEFVQLKNLIEQIKEHMSGGFKTQVDIGGNIFMQAKVPDTQKILVNIGLNHYMELTLDEALRFCDNKIKSLQKDEDVIREKSIEIRANIKLALLCLAEQYMPVEKE